MWTQKRRPNHCAHIDQNNPHGHHHRSTTNRRDPLFGHFQYVHKCRSVRPSVIPRRPVPTLLPHENEPFPPNDSSPTNESFCSTTPFRQRAKFPCIPSTPIGVHVPIFPNSSSPNYPPYTQSAKRVVPGIGAKSTLELFLGRYGCSDENSGYFCPIFPRRHFTRRSRFDGSTRFGHFGECPFWGRLGRWDRP